MKFTKQNLLDLSPCSDGLVFARRHKYQWAKVWEKCERGDWLVWWLRQTGQLDKVTAVKIAVACAEHVLATFEGKYPGDLRPRQAIEAAKKVLENDIEENRIAADSAAHSARSAYWAAHSAAYSTPLIPAS